MSTHVAPAVEDTVTRDLRGYAASAALGVGAVATAATFWSAWQSSVYVDPKSTAVLRAMFVAGWFAAGAYIWWRRPERRLGPLVVTIGLLASATSLTSSANELAYSIGRVLLAGVVVYILYVFLCFPGDRLGSRLEHGLVTALAVATVALWVPLLVLADSLPKAGALAQCRSNCPANAFQVASTSHAVTDALNTAAGAVTAAFGAGIALVLARKARSPSRLRRRAVEPLLYAFVAQIVVYIAASVADPGADGLRALRVTAGVTALAVPVAMIAGQARIRWYAAETLGKLVAQVRGKPVTPERAESLLRDALGDPTLSLALWDRERSHYIGVDGEPIDVENMRPGRDVTRVTHGERPVAALIHTRLLDEASGVLDGLAETTLLLLENTWLVDELRASRARIVDAGDRERRRLERDLHDGAQQRLFLLQVELARAQERVRGTEVAAELERIGDDAAAALEELRVLAHGIYPTVLRDLGLAEALRAQAAEAPVPVTVVDNGAGRCSPTIETAVYFCALEAIQNAAKHAGRGANVTVRLDRRGDEAAFAIEDDGAGFQPGSGRDGFGLEAMRDRIGAVGGELRVSSRPGGGATVEGAVPQAPLRSTDVVFDDV